MNLGNDNIFNETWGKNHLLKTICEDENSKVLITGDTHGDGFKRIKDAKTLGGSILIICGDFGYVWNNIKTNDYNLNIINDIGIKVLFLDGNHEDFDLLEKYPKNMMFGGEVQILRENIIHLLRGEIYTINNKRIFIIGGANSTDKEYRVLGESFWKQEVPNLIERDRAIQNLEMENNKVDIILTHTPPSSILKLMNKEYRIDEYTDFLEYIKKTTSYRHWYFGHIHENKKVDKKHTCVYTNFVNFHRI